MVYPAIIIDDRENKPLPFPEHLTTHDRSTTFNSAATRVVQLRTKVQRLPFGDYCLEGHASTCCIERKADLGEIAWNLLTPDRPRALTAFTRLYDNCLHPWLILETDMLELSSPLKVPHCKTPFDPNLVVSTLMAHLATLPRLRVLTLRASTQSRRLAVGSLVAHILLSHYPPLKEVLPCPTILLSNQTVP